MKRDRRVEIGLLEPRLHGNRRSLKDFRCIGADHVNADDPVIFGCGLLDEYELARRVFGLDDTVLAAIAANSIRASGAPESIRTSALARIDEWLLAIA